jgi:hypothetical protein
LSLDAVLREAVRDALATELPAVLAHLHGEPRMLPIKETPVSYRLILEAEKRGELTVFRVGKASLVDASELFEWIRRAGCKQAAPATQPDAVGELLELDRARRAKRKGTSA